MRPRSRLLAKRRLQLPTITEGYEDLVRDMNHANTLHSAPYLKHSSEEDYLLSICQLARPTFSSQDGSSSCDIINTRLQDPLRQKAWLARRRATPDLKPDALGNKDVCDVTTTRQVARRGCHGVADPLEYLYGRQNDPVASTCRSGSLSQRLAEERGGRSQGERSEKQIGPRGQSFSRSPSVSVPKLRPPVTPSPAPSAPAAPVVSPPPQRRPALRAGEGERSEVKRSLVSGWICDCRAAWREARHRACMLPSIAEI